MRKGRSLSGRVSSGLLTALLLFGISINAHGDQPKFSHLDGFYKKLNDIAKKDKDHPEKVKADIANVVTQDEVDAISAEEELLATELDDAEDQLVSDSKVHTDDEMTKEEHAFFEKRGHDLAEADTLARNPEYAKVYTQIEEALFHDGAEPGDTGE